MSAGVNSDSVYIPGVMFTDQVVDPAEPGLAHSLVYTKGGQLYIYGHDGTPAPVGAAPTLAESLLAVGGSGDTLSALSAGATGAVPTRQADGSIAEVVPTGGGGGGALTLVEELAAANSATLAFTDWLGTGTEVYLIQLLYLQPATDGANLLLTCSVDGGATWIATGYNWSYGYNRIGNSGGGQVNGGAATAIHIADANSNATGQGAVVGEIRLFAPGSAHWKELTWAVVQQNVGGGSPAYRYDGGAVVPSTSAIDGLRFAFSSGNIASGSVRIYSLA